jgi:hypothetical protein
LEAPFHPKNHPRDIAGSLSEAFVVGGDYFENDGAATGGFIALYRQ